MPALAGYGYGRESDFRTVKRMKLKIKKRKRLIGSISEIIPPLVAGPISFVGFVLVFTLTELDLALSALIFFGIYIVFSVIYLWVILDKRTRSEREADGKATFTSVIEGFLQRSDVPMCGIDHEGKIFWSNAAANELFDRTSIFGDYFDELSPVTLNSVLADNGTALEVAINGKYYETNGHSVVSGVGKTISYVYFKDTTKEVLWKNKFEARELCVAAIYLDNLAELSAQTGQGEYRDAATLIDRALKEWAASVNAIIKELNNERYIMVFNHEYLEEMCKKRFPILDTVQELQADSLLVPLTVSIGVATEGESLAEKETESLIALDHALQRGGAQVALRRDTEGYEFFGGRTKTSQKRTSIRSRIEADRLISLIKRAGNVIVMAHANPDFDAIGSCLGLARLAETYGREALVVTNTECPNFKLCTARLMKKDSDGYYQNLFADRERGLDAVRSDTLVILTDVNSVQRCECPQIALNCARIAVVDHHRKEGGGMTEAHDISYVDPSASSACEMVSEMLDYSPLRVELEAEEANVMMSGIMLDTQNFAKNVGTRTFSAALYLRNVGASNEIANTFFFENMADYTAQTRIISNSKRYKSKYIIAVNVLDEESDARTIAAKAANKLLSIRGTEACFVLACVGNNVSISARSNGKINVQEILAKMGGGGHFDAAGAQTDVGSEATLTRLQKAIDDYEAELLQSRENANHQ